MIIIIMTNFNNSFQKYALSKLILMFSTAVTTSTATTIIAKISEVSEELIGEEGKQYHSNY